MLAIATWMARTLWRIMLWSMRRPLTKQIQRKSVLLFPPTMRERAWRSMVKQNKFARRIGLPMLTSMMSLVVGSILISGSFMLAMRLYEMGYLSVPRRLRRRLLID
jgi:hypothetical protein